MYMHTYMYSHIHSGVQRLYYYTIDVLDIGTAILLCLMYIPVLSVVSYSLVLRTLTPYDILYSLQYYHLGKYSHVLTTTLLLLLVTVEHSSYHHVRPYSTYASPPIGVEWGQCGNEHNNMNVTAYQ